MKVICNPLSIPVNPPVDRQYTLFGRSGIQSLGEAGPTLLDDITYFGVSPDPRAWDLLAIALSVVSADEGCARNRSADGWTREIQLEVSVQDARFWDSQKPILQKILRFLTGDIWNLSFVSGGLAAPKIKKNKRKSDEEAVCLLSGGADSLSGAIDLKAQGKNLLLVSQISDGDKGNQRVFADVIAGVGHHLQLNHNISSPVVGERSQRSRSILFIAYGVLGATVLETFKAGNTVKLYVPENGFISLNIPLTPLRIGSLSTRTTHPYYFRLVQTLLDNAGLQVSIENPYQFKTKGELFSDCQTPELLKRFVCESTSCGRFKRNAYRHCGRCVPCLIRRAALHKWKFKDTTTYVYGDLSINDGDHKDFDDVRSACFAVQKVKAAGLDEWVGGCLSSTQVGETKDYKALLERGVAELGAFLKSAGAM
ncbi:MAG: hypothetical protein JWR26_2683 [Pedosphaera sp.]|nr:hypothetical protein [Pedosphaera sp.]